MFTFGNGGSATDAADLAHALGPKGWALSDDVATVTALANDVSFDVVFARQLATLARPGDAVVALSTSGTSANVLAGLAEAQRLGLGTIGLRRLRRRVRWRGAGLDVCCVVRVVVGAPHPGDVRVAVRRDGARRRRLITDRRGGGRAATTAWPRLMPPSLHGTRRWRRTS